MNSFTVSLPPASAVLDQTSTGEPGPASRGRPPSAKMKKLLIVSPHFPPMNTPDLQRVRTSLSYYAENGWEPTVLTMEPPEGREGCDDLLARSVSKDIRVISVPAWRERNCRRFGFGHADYRYPVPLHRAGARLLAAERFDLAFFSTTVFNTMALGRRWRSRFGLPYVLDLQDPWYSGITGRYRLTKAPGGMLKYCVSEGIARFLEPYTLRRAAHLISVSEGYVDTLTRRYPWLARDRFTVLPFGAPEGDFELLRKASVTQRIFQPEPGRRNWVYVGRGGPDLVPVLRMLFRAVAEARRADPARWAAVRFHFVGTNYSPAHRTFKVVEPVAIEEGVGDLVAEHPVRIPYFEALKVLADSDGIILPGSRFAEYTASKLLPCLLAQRPLLAIFDERSLVAKLLRSCPGTRLAAFADAGQMEQADAGLRAGLEWLLTLPQGVPHQVDWSALEAYTARRLTARQCEIFDRCVVASKA